MHGRNIPYAGDREPTKGGRAGFRQKIHGAKNYFSDLKCAVPFRRRGHGSDHRGENVEDVILQQKRFNRQLSKERVMVEHTISRMKFRIMANEFRNRLRNYDVMTDIVSDLVNLRILGQ